MRRMKRSLTILIKPILFAVVALLLPQIGFSQVVSTAEFERIRGPQLEEYFRSEALRLIDVVSGNSIHLMSIQGVNLSELQDKIKGIQIRFSMNMIVNRINEHSDDPSELRFGGHYAPNKIQIAYETFSELQNSNMLPVLALHECMGALGYSDRLYEKSFALYLLARADAFSRENLLNYWVSNASFISEPVIFRSTPVALNIGDGGGTQVGGGGDTFTLRYKGQILDLYEKKIKHMGDQKRSKKWSEFATKLQWVDIEPSEYTPNKSNFFYRLNGNVSDSDFRIEYSSFLNMDDPVLENEQHAVIQDWMKIIDGIPLKNGFVKP